MEKEREKKDTPTFIIESKNPTVWANFTLGSNSVKGKAQPNILYKEI